MRAAASAAGRPLPGLVSLAACTTHRAGRAYDEAVTLSTAFLVAGATTAIGSLWPVPDRETARLTVTFHDNLADGMPPHEALRAVQRSMRQPSDEVSLPAWAGLVAWDGDGGGFYQDPIGDAERERATRAALADHDRDHRALEARHHLQRLRDRLGLAALLGAEAGIRARRVDEADDRPAEPRRHAASGASPCDSPRGAPSRSCGACSPSCCGPSGGRARGLPTRRTARMPPTIAGSSRKLRSPCSSTKSSMSSPT